MNLKNILDPIDKLIHQAKEFAKEKDNRKSSIKAIDMRAAQLQPDLEKRRDELRKLLGEISQEDGQNDLVKSLSDGLGEVNELIANIRLVVEKEWIEEELDDIMSKRSEERKEFRERYVNSEISKLQEEISRVTSFFELSTLANQIWADFELFEEFNRDEMVMGFLVERMNETNQKNTETHLGRDLKITLEHIRTKLFKNSAWSDQELEQYVEERNLEIKRLKQIKTPITQSHRFFFAGASEKLIEALKNEYYWPEGIKIEWMDVLKRKKNDLPKQADCNQVFIVTFFNDCPAIKDLTETLTERKIPFTTSLSVAPCHYFDKIEESVIEKEFSSQFNRSR